MAQTTKRENGIGAKKLQTPGKNSRKTLKSSLYPGRNGNTTVTKDLKSSTRFGRNTVRVSVKVADTAHRLCPHRLSPLRLSRWVYGKPRFTRHPKRTSTSRGSRR